MMKDTNNLLDAARSALAWMIGNLHGGEPVAEKLAAAILKANEAAADQEAIAELASKPRASGIIEATEEVTVYRDSKGEFKGLIVESKLDDGSYFAAYERGFRSWSVIASGWNKERVLSEAREYFFYHSHECPECGCMPDGCAEGYRCDDHQKEVLCEECAEEKKGSTVKKRLEYRGYESLRLHISGDWTCPSSRGPGEGLDMFTNARWDGAGYRMEAGAQEWTKEFCTDDGYIAASDDEREQPEDSHLEMEYEARTDPDCLL